MDRPFLAPPGVPDQRLRALRAAFHDAVNDPQFLADAKRQRIEVKEIPAQDVERVIAATYAVPVDVVKFATESMNLSAGTGAAAN
jgi:tripartite-type tricarboxylate transporter receptor subunit TctC